MDVTALQKKAVDGAIEKFCEGQEPRTLDTIVWTDKAGISHLGVTEEQYRAAEQWVKIYIVGNDEQWVEACLP